MSHRVKINDSSMNRFIDELLIIMITIINELLMNHRWENSSMFSCAVDDWDTVDVCSVFQIAFDSLNYLKWHQDL